MRLVRWLLDVVVPRDVIVIERSPVNFEPMTVKCPNCGWDGKRDAAPLLASLIEDARRDAVRLHTGQGDTASGSRKAS